MRLNEYDPLSVFTTPPPDETPEERIAREKKESEEQHVSDMIDEEIKQEKAALRKQKYLVRVLLLGQSESGKSTTLKNFRMKYARTAWREERASWRAVIQLNLLRSIITIVETLQAEMDNEPLERPPTEASSFVDEEPVASSSTATVPRAGSSKQASSSSSAFPAFGGYGQHQDIPLSAPLTGKHQLLKLRLGPLRRVEADLRKRLGAGADEDRGQFDLDGNIIKPTHPTNRRPTKEFGVRAWKDALFNESQQKQQNLIRPTSKGSHSTDSGGDGCVDEATEVIASCRDDMKTLWMDEAVKAVLAKRKLRLEDSAGFFLDDLDRVATRTYEPSDDDVLRARLRTLGVQEYRIQLEVEQSNTIFAGNQDFGRDWILYDVGGSRTIRHAWLPYFDNVNAIIFLAPISCFDERLLEDSRVNRLEDSFLLWRSICASKLLAGATMILFLNKCDLLKKKLRSGIMVKTYLPSFGDRTNDAPTVVKYLKEKFRDIMKQQRTDPRTTYIYATSVIDTKATSATLKMVRDSILREHLKSADFV